MITAKVRRKDELFAKLRRMAPDAADALVAEGNAAADEMVRIARNYAPVKEGDLRDSIVATRAGAATPLYSQPGGSTIVPDGAVLVTAGNSKVRYPHLVEYGTRPHVNQGQFPGTQHPGTVAQPYFWPAFRLLRRRFRSRMTRAFNKAMKKVAAS